MKMSSKSMHNLNVRYYFITDQIEKGHDKVTSCPTHETLADFFTKPLQSAVFVQMREKNLEPAHQHK